MGSPSIWRAGLASVPTSVASTVGFERLLREEGGVAAPSSCPAGRRGRRAAPPPPPHRARGRARPTRASARDSKLEAGPAPPGPEPRRGPARWRSHRRPTDLLALRALGAVRPGHARASRCRRCRRCRPGAGRRRRRRCRRCRRCPPGAVAGRRVVRASWRAPAVVSQAPFDPFLGWAGAVAAVAAVATVAGRGGAAAAVAALAAARPAAGRSADAAGCHRSRRCPACRRATSPAEV